jgi:glucosylceramidase
MSAITVSRWGPPRRPMVRNLALAAALVLAATLVAAATALRQRGRGKRQHLAHHHQRLGRPQRDQGLQQQTSISFARTSAGANQTITVNENTRYQQFIGAGASFTDTAAWLMNSSGALSSSTRSVPGICVPQSVRPRPRQAQAASVPTARRLCRKPPA